jgi:hypothetical protein
LVPAPQWVVRSPISPLRLGLYSDTGDTDSEYCNQSEGKQRCERGTVASHARAAFLALNLTGYPA